MDTEKVNIWLDCDVGNDDAMALILALFHPKSNLLGISTCFGNTSLENCTNNTIRLLSSLGRTDVPVYKGAEFSLKSTRATTKMHGTQGLYSVDKLISSFKPIEDMDLYDLIKQTAGDQEFVIVITGPQTNIAKLLRDHEDIIPQIQEIVFMGGTSGFGNVTPSSEYNIYSDPEAAQFVIDTCKQHSLKLVMISLDLTYTCQLLEPLQQRIKSINTKFSDWCLEMLQEYQAAYKAQEFDYPPIHDPVAVFYALHPEMYVIKPVYCAVDCESKLCYGRTVIDKQGILGQEPTLQFARKVVVDQFWNQMIEAIQVAAKNSKIE
ncbi:unnamed protein product (macronuclear) [Paramecium tetraurelia]|uniref:Inosine/uridine-preferring nucleoside hydrolase domain-containing protein n=1 Tax=Paramecium tetraurelia TaxID=5888 RepID=A0DT21_PARTE|nr:uncharacterized protein GSPATT00019881001 [Paramecium tetraurelia]CAK86188.1 unnamed protein product [Paramecium tetraurelia]|eukprot:XP_001453585.1 hypothetical protein (macronuclear) [Paramecium tetraurelia strain d4-2]